MRNPLEGLKDQGVIRELKRERWHSWGNYSGMDGRGSLDIRVGAPEYRATRNGRTLYRGPDVSLAVQAYKTGKRVKPT